METPRQAGDGQTHLTKSVVRALPEEVDEILKRRDAEDMERLGVTNDGLGAPAESEVTEDGVIGT